MKCKYCGFEMPAGAQYCEECGAAAEEKITFKKDNQQQFMQDVNAPQGYSTNYADQQYNGQQGVSGQQYGDNQQGYGNQQYGSSQQGYNNNNQQYGSQNYGYQQPNSGYSQSGNGMPFSSNYAASYNNVPDYNMTADSPRYVDCKEALRLFIKNYSNFSGRSTRSEYWYVYLVMAVAYIAFTILGGIGSAILGKWVWGLTMVIMFLVSIALLVPNLAICVRRLHDTGKSGLTILISCIPYIGSFILLVFLAQASGPANQYGPAPNPDVHAYDSNHINML